MKRRRWLKREFTEQPEARRAVDARRLLDVARHRLQTGEDQQHHERRPLPDQFGHHTHERELRQPVDVNSQRTERPVDQAVGRREQARFPQQRRSNRCDQEGSDEQSSYYPSPQKLSVEQQCEDEPQHHRDQNRSDDQHDRVQGDLPELAVGEDGRVILESDESTRTGSYQVPRLGGVVQGEHEGDLCHHDHEDERGQQRPTSTPTLGARDLISFGRDRRARTRVRLCRWRHHCGRHDLLLPLV